MTGLDRLGSQSVIQPSSALVGLWKGCWPPVAEGACGLSGSKGHIQTEFQVIYDQAEDAGRWGFSCGRMSRLAIFSFQWTPSPTPPDSLLEAPPSNCIDPNPSRNGVCASQSNRSRSTVPYHERDDGQSPAGASTAELVLRGQ